MAQQQLLEALQPALDSIPHLPAANSPDKTCAARVRLILEAESVSRNPIVTALLLEPRLMQQMVDKSGKSLPCSFTHQLAVL